MNLSQEINLLYEQIALENQLLDCLYSNKEDLSAQRKELFERLDEVRLTIDDLCTEIEGLSSDISVQYSHKADYVYELNHKRDEIDSAYANHEDYSSIYWLKSSRDTIVEHLRDINSEIDDLKSRKNYLVDDLLDAKDERASIYTKLAETKKQLGEVVEEIKYHKDKKRVLRETLTELKKKR